MRPLKSRVFRERQKRWNLPLPPCTVAERPNTKARPTAPPSERRTQRPNARPNARTNERMNEGRCGVWGKLRNCHTANHQPITVLLSFCQKKSTRELTTDDQRCRSTLPREHGIGWTHAKLRRHPSPRTTDRPPPPLVGRWSVVGRSVGRMELRAGGRPLTHCRRSARSISIALRCRG